ncbi:MAG: ribonuclease [Mesorhizobium amorphae]|nr:MAG: ribonuclease [Mesorhizobium amorphae]
MRRFLAALGLSFGLLPPAAAGAEDFDFYVLALSWSPSYCEAEGADANRFQCGAQKPYSFVVHGLWPQNERGYPEFCDTSERDVPRETMRAMSDLMPSFGLVRHQWRKHGSCSGLDQDAYFALVRQARERITIPTEFRRPASARTVEPHAVETRFRSSNPGLAADAIAVTCDRERLREVRICLNKDLSFRSCPEVDRRSCRLGRASMPPPVSR